MEQSRFLALSSVERYALFLFVFLPRGYSPDEMEFAFFSKHVKKSSARAVEKLLIGLAKQKLLSAPSWGGMYDSYRLAAELAPDQIADLVESADKGSWWPRREEIEASIRGRYGQYVAREDETDLVCSFSELLRIFLCGASPGDSQCLDRTLRGRNGETLLRAVAQRAVSLLGKRGEPAFNAGSWKLYSFRRIFPVWLDYAFVSGARTTAAMDFMDRLLASGSKADDSVAGVYSALAVWRAEPSRIDHPQILLNPLGKALRDAAKGEFSAADAALSELLRDTGVLPPAPGRYPGVRAAFGFLSVRFLAVFAEVAAKPEKPPKTRPGQLFRAMQPEEESYSYYAHGYTSAVRDICVSFARDWRESMHGKGTLVMRWSQAVELTPLRALLFAWDYRWIAGPRTRLRVKSAALAEEASHLAAEGYGNLAFMIFGLISGGYDAAEFAPVLETLRGRAVPFFPVCEPDPDWKGALSAMDKALEKAVRAKNREEMRKGGGFFWYVSFRKGIDGQLEFREAYPAVRSANAPEDGSSDDVYWMSDFREKKFSDIMSPADRLLHRMLEMYGDGYYDSGYDDGEMLEIVRQLVGMPNLLRCDKVSPGQRTVVAHNAVPLTVREGAPSVETSFAEDGGMSLSLPPWLAASRDRRWLLREADHGTVEVVEITKAAQSVIGAFYDYGVNGRLKFPREAAEKAEKVLGRLGELMPVSEKTAAGDASLPRVKGAAELSVRLSYADGALKVHPVVQPIPENQNITLDPGLGPAEKLVVGAVRSYVLVRDMDAERAALSRVSSALAAFERAHDGGVRWTFDDISDALDALVALKSAEPPLPLTWLQEKRLSVSSAPKSGVALRSARTAEDWFRVEGEFKLDDGRVLGIMQIVDAMSARTGRYVRLSDGDYVAITDEMRRQIAALGAAGVRRSGALEFTKAAVPMLDGVFGEGDGSLELPEAMRPAADEIRAAFARRPEPPSTLQAELRPYQREGYRWLSRLAACGLGACLADDMGLGKTLETIALLLERSADGATLVLAPSSVCGNWRRELNRFAPTLNPLLPQEDPSCIASAGPRDIVIASYGYLLFHVGDFAAKKWNGVVLDEAQAIKNDASKRAKAVKRLSARFRVAATGTPVENRLGELWSLFDFLNPGLLGPASSFALRFTEDGMASPELKRLVKPLILRRLKGDVIDDLPEKTEVTLPIELGTAERTAYEACRRRALESLESADGGQASRMSILAELTRLRRFCCHPSLVLGTNEVPSAKLEALSRLLEELRLGGHRALVFSQFTDFLAIVRRLVETRGWTYRYLDGSTPTLARESLVNEFQSGEGDFFLISLKAGGTGLNLTAADYVILLDPWWNPAVENQATDRAHRIGQRRPVTVYRLIASDTVEERVLALHKEKQAIAEDVLEGTASSSLTPAQLMALFR